MKIGYNNKCAWFGRDADHEESVHGSAGMPIMRKKQMCMVRQGCRPWGKFSYVQLKF
jgi:hypothetical protein